MPRTVRCAAGLAVVVLTTARAAEPLRLTLEDAVRRGLETNLAAIESREAVKAAEGAKNEALAPLLPSLRAGLAASRQVINLAAYGFPAPAGGSPLVGPFNVLDARLYLSQEILDISDYDLRHAKGLGEEAARSSAAATRETVVVACAGLYLRAAADLRRIEDVREQVTAAQTLYDRAVHLKESGVIAGIEVLRAQVEREAQRQRLIVAENEEAKDKLALARAIGLPLDQPFTLAEGLVYRRAGEIALDAALHEAYAARAEIRRAESDVAAAEATREADRHQRIPTLQLNGDYGVIGPDEPSLEKTYTIGMQLRLPLFEGGRISAKVMQDDAEVTRRRAVLSDLQAGIALEARSALLDLTSADERVTVATGALDLSRAQLSQSQDRFEAGVAGNLEVVQAQDALARASDDYLAALLAHNVARLTVARARGSAEREIPTFLTGEGGPPHD